MYPDQAPQFFAGWYGRSYIQFARLKVQCFGLANLWAQQFGYENLAPTADYACQMLARHTGDWQRLPAHAHAYAGDVAVFSSAVGGGCGHTGVLVSDSPPGGMLDLAQQDGWNQSLGCHRATWYRRTLLGFLRPPARFARPVTPTPAETGAYIIRTVVTNPINRLERSNLRAKPYLDAPIVNSLPPGFAAKLTHTARGDVVATDPIWCRVPGPAGGWISRERLNPPKATHGIPAIHVPR